MARVLEFKKSDTEIGIYVRTQIDGPESDMLNMFIEQYLDKLCASKQHYALFYEPLLPTGYPDLVIVSYSPNKYESWTKERAKIGVLELKVLHHLYFVKGATSSSIEKQLGIESGLLLKILERLMDASLVRRTKQQWSPKPLSHSYGICNIRTIEAKISDWQSAISQASINRWFSSESFVLSPASRHSEQVLNSAKTKGIGIYSMPSNTRAKIIQKPERLGGLPVSYASWLFNEWIGRQLSRSSGVSS
jgi:predicted transcriptional regulator